MWSMASSLAVGMLLLAWMSMANASSLLVVGSYYGPTHAFYGPRTSPGVSTVAGASTIGPVLSNETSSDFYLGFRGRDGLGLSYYAAAIVQVLDGGGYTEPDTVVNEFETGDITNTNTVLQFDSSISGYLIVGSSINRENDRVSFRLNDDTQWRIFVLNFTAATAAPTPAPIPTPKPSNAPTMAPVPTPKPTAMPTDIPTVEPTSAPTASPSVMPTGSPSVSPTEAPTASPTTGSPTEAPTEAPTASPTTGSPTTASPTAMPTTEDDDVPGSGESGSGDGGSEQGGSDPTTIGAVAGAVVACGGLAAIAAVVYRRRQMAGAVPTSVVVAAKVDDRRDSFEP